LISGALALGLRRFRPDARTTKALAPAALELALMAFLYAIWRIGRELPFTHEDGAIERARQIVDFQHFLHLPTELSLQRFVIDHDWLARFTNTYYAALHVPALIAFLVWMYVRQRDAYPHWRNGLVLVTAACLVIRFVRVAPPRFLPDLGYVDLSTRYGLSLYGPVGKGASDQFAAMPSIHVAWAAVVSFGIFVVVVSWVRWLFLLHVILTMLVVSASGNHWWLDGIVAILLLAGALAIDTRVRRAASRRRATADPPAVVDLDEPDSTLEPAPTP
jgi:hypothetical protein